MTSMSWVKKLTAAGTILGVSVFGTVKYNEGYSERSYYDGAGVATICYGETKNVKIGEVRTKAQCDAQLNESVRSHAKVFDGVPSSTPDVVALGLLDLAYNAGTFIPSVKAQKSPSQLNAAVDYLASPEFLALQKMGATFDQEAVEGAKNAVSSNYNEKLIPAVRDTWEQAKTTVGAPQSVQQIGRVTIPVENKKATTSVVRYVWTGNSIQFSAAPGYEKNASVLAKAKELQKSLAPLINKSVRMAAHLDGSQEYTKYFKDNEQAFFGASAEETTNAQ